MASFVLYFSPNMPPDNMAAAVRGSLFLQALEKQKISVRMLTTSYSPGCTSTFFKLASNRSSFLKRFLAEVLVGCELIVRLIMMGLSGQLPAVVVLSSPPYITNWLASFGCQFCQLPYAIDARDLYPEVYFNQKLFKRDSLLGRIQSAMAARFYNRATHIFTVTQGCKNIIESYLPKADAGKVEVIRNGFVEADFQNLNVNKRNSFTCLFHGNLGLLQNIELLKEVIEKTNTLNPDIQFLLAGSGPQEYILKHIQHSSFHYLGEVAQRDIPALIASCHIGLSFRPSNEYTDVAFPVKIFEYIGAGVPTIATPPIDTIREIASKGMGFLFQNNEGDKIVEAIIELAREPEKYKNLVAQIQKHRSEYSRTAGSTQFAKGIAKAVANSLGGV